MGWLQTTITTKEVGWKIVLKLFLLASISFVISERLGISNMNIYIKFMFGLYVVLGLSGFWFCFTRIVPEQ